MKYTFLLKGKAVCVLSLLLMIWTGAAAQFNPPSPTVPSADLAPSKQNIQVNNDLYNGRISVNVPIFSYSFEGLSMPVSLNYSGGNGIKTDELPSWVGLGWNLQAGGYVHRTVRGKPDETLDFQTVEQTINFWYGGIPYKSRTTTQNTTDYSYYSNVSKLTASNWSTLAFSNTLKPSQSNYPYTLPSSDASGDAINSTYYNHHPTYDLAPDEFTFAVGNVSGKFYLNYQNKWIVESNDERTYTVNTYVGPVTHSAYTIPRVIKYLTLTSTDGIRFTFGNTDLSALLANQLFDYSRTSSTLPANPSDANPIPGATLIDIVPHTWHLTKIENLKTGSATTLSYKYVGWQFYKSRQCWGNEGGTVYNNNQIFYSDPNNWNSYYRLSATSKIATRAWTLTDINYPNGITLHFESTPSTQLSTDQTLQGSDNSGFYQYEDMYTGAGGNNNLLKLDKITLAYNGVVKKETDLAYSSTSTTRLKLTSVTEKDVAGNAGSVYQFQYNIMELPAYGAGLADHWGFYNNKDFFASVAAPYNFTKLSGYSPYRDQDDTYLQACMLSKVIYPTGGSVEFTFEPNKYSQKRSNADFTLTNLGANTEGAGVRVSKILYRASDASTTEKDYDYSIPGSASISSGILSGPPSDYITGNTSSYSFRSAGFSPVYYSGSPVTYTYVTEKTPGNGSTLYQYANYENGFNDGLPIERNTGPITAFDFAYVNNARKRGKLLSMKTYKEGVTTPVMETTLHYEHENSEASKPEVRSLYFKEQGSAAYYYASISERVYNDFLTEKDQLMNSDQGALTEKTTTSYDSYGNIKQVVTYDSKGQVVRQKFKYCQEYAATAADNVSQGIKKQNDLSILNAPVEKIVYRENADGSNSMVIGGSLYTYKTNSAFLDKVYDLQIGGPVAVGSFTESYISGGALVSDARYSTPAVQYDSYDSKGNVLQLTPENGAPQSYIWGYNQSFRVADIKNAPMQSNTEIIPSTTTLANSAFLPKVTSGPVGSVSMNYAQTFTLQGSITVVSNNPTNVNSFQIAVTNTTTNTLVYNNYFYPNTAVNISIPITVGGTFAVTYGYSTYDNTVATIVTMSLSASYSNQRTRYNIFYTSFEEDASAVDNTNSVTGGQSHVGTYNVPLPAINGNYTLTYWTKPSSGGTWTLNKEAVTVSSGASADKAINSGGGLLDEVRFYPQGAMMTTYTYDPVFGVTSQCDVNNKATYYQYDALGRLGMVRDQYKNIIKAICYNYSGQPESCILNTTPNWQSTNIVRCQPGINGYTTGHLERQEQDFNVYSPSWNTIRWIDLGPNNSACRVAADYQNTSTPVRCKKDASNVNTGEQEQEQKDMNPYSGTYNQIIWTVVGTNLTACPIPCNTTNCSGTSHKCVNGVCQTGILDIISATNSGGKCTTKWGYFFTDGTSQLDHTTVTTGACKF